MKRSALMLLLGFATTAAFAANAPKADAVAGKAIVDKICAACHGADGNSAASANPSLAGQHAEYLVAQLNAFKKGERKSFDAATGKVGPSIMSGQAAMLSDDDIRNVAAYFSQQKPKDRAATNKELQAQGKKIYTGGIAATGVPACMACHGPNGAGIPVQYPRVGSQHGAYIAAQIANFRNGEARKNAPMHDIALKLSEQDTKAVAEYIQGLR
ncbi:cytochrome c4 [Burkholderiaceae bacterium DAT-1]|nr:cytochrome c4 [Burkholderiaceae bacterium DAT-1]